MDVERARCRSSPRDQCTTRQRRRGRASSVRPPAPISCAVTVRSVLGDTWLVYRRLLWRTVAIGAGVFVVLELPGSFLGVVDSRAAAAGLALASLLLSFVGSLLVQGALSQAVRDVHVGALERSVAGLYRDTRPRLGALVVGSLLLLLAIGGAFAVTGALAIAVVAAAGRLGLPALALPLVAIFVLFTRWSLIVPVIVLENAPVLGAFRRSGELVRGHGWTVFRVLFAVSALTAAGGFALRFAFGALPGVLGVWIGAAIATGLTAPYMAHALTVVYYRLTEPTTPLLAEPSV